MAFGMGEDPRKSPMALLEGVQYPASKADLLAVVEEGEAPAEVINLIMSLPRDEYLSQEEVLRDLAEAGRRFGMSNQRADDDGANRDRRNIGRDAVEDAPEGMTRHP
ncbi:MAG: DUF2795 domain-containing protein [Myxococcaceae bacterium]